MQGLIMSTKWNDLEVDFYHTIEARTAEKTEMESK